MQEIEIKEKEDKNNLKIDKNNKKEWKKPTLEDVSERVMAKPYIRFT